MEQDTPPVERLANFPVAFFSMVMGMAGLTIAWEKAHQVFSLDFNPGLPLAGVTVLLFVVLLSIYAAKFSKYRPQVIQEWRHPVKLNFFPTLSISLLLLAIVSLPLDKEISRPLWMAGTALHLVFTLFVMNIWMHHEHFQIQHLNPAWFIPVVGNVLVPVAGVPLGYQEISWFFFSVGMLFWLVLLTIIFYRVFFHNPLDQRLMPTLFILIAPPAVGFIAYTKLNGELDAFGRVLYYSGLFLTLTLVTQLPRFARLNFFLSWWAYSFPMAAISISSMLMYEKTGLPGFRWLAMVLLAVLSALILLLIVRTANAVRQHRICVPGH